MAKQDKIIGKADIPAWIIKTSPKSFGLWDKEKQLEYAQMRKEKNLANAQRYAAINKEEYIRKHRINNAAYREKNRLELRVKNREKNKKLYHDNIVEMRKRARERMKHLRETDKGFLAKQNISRRIRHLLNKSGEIKKDCTLVYVGCSTQELKTYLESNMESWMNWDNYGSKWEIDHIMPCSAFDHTNQDQIKQCWHYLNLRPLSVTENRSKHAKIRHPQLSLMLPIF